MKEKNGKKIGKTYNQGHLPFPLGNIRATVNSSVCVCVCVFVFSSELC